MVGRRANELVWSGAHLKKRFQDAPEKRGRRRFSRIAPCLCAPGVEDVRPFSHHISTSESSRHDAEERAGVCGVGRGLLARRRAYT